MTAQNTTASRGTTLFFPSLCMQLFKASPTNTYLQLSSGINLKFILPVERAHGTAIKRFCERAKAREGGGRGIIRCGLRYTADGHSSPVAANGKGKDQRGAGRAAESKPAPTTVTPTRQQCDTKRQRKRPEGRWKGSRGKNSSNNGNTNQAAVYVTQTELPSIEKWQKKTQQQEKYDKSHHHHFHRQPHDPHVPEHPGQKLRRHEG